MSELVRGTSGEALDYFGNRYVIFADAAATEGRYGLMLLSLRAGREPPPHTHAREDEACWILSGRWTFSVGDETFDASPTQFVQLPRGIQHRITVDRDGASALVLIAPGGFEEAFRTLGRPFGGDGMPPLPDGPPDIKAILRVMTEHGVTISPPGA